MAGFEYAHLSAGTKDNDHLVARLNDLSVEGWELVSSHATAEAAGPDRVTLMIRRAIVPLSEPGPGPAEPGWYPDPTGRWHGRLWNGQAWTFWAMNREDGMARRDPPTMRAPSEGLRQ